MSEYPVARPARGPSSYGFPTDQSALLDWSFVTARLLEARNYWFATVRPDGRPHVTPLWAVWVDTHLYFDGAPSTRWSRNIAQNPHIAVHLESGSEAAIIDGIAEDIPAMNDAALADKIVAEWDRKYGRLHPDPAGRGILCLHPRVIRAWSTEALTDATCWQFE